MGLKLTRKPKRLLNAGPESISLQSAYYDHLRLVGNDDQPVCSTRASDFVDENSFLDKESTKRLFDHLWASIESDKRSRILLDLSGVRDVDPLFLTELTYLSGQLRRQCRFIRLVAVDLKGDWSDWL